MRGGPSMDEEDQFQNNGFPVADVILQSNPKILNQLHALYLKKRTQNYSLWSSLIRSYICQGLHKEALLIYAQNCHEAVKKCSVFPLLLKACASLSFLRLGRTFHAASVKMGTVEDVMIGTSLVSLYSKCQDIVAARCMFDEMPRKNVVTLNAMIDGYSRTSDMTSASLLFEQMSERSQVTWTEMIDGFARSGDTARARQYFDRVPFVMKNVVTWTVMVDGYARNGEMEAASQVFEEMPQRNFYAWSCMIDGYCKKGDLTEARKVFDLMPVRNLVNWNVLIAGYAQNGICKEALEAFKELQSQGFKPDEVTIASVLSACGQLASLEDGTEIHKLIHRERIKVNQFVLNGLVDMYSKCGDLRTAKTIFEGMNHRNEVCWNSMITGLAIHGESEQALEFFSRMESSEVMPNEITFLSLLWACAHGGFVEEGLEIFSKMKDQYGLNARREHYGCLVDLLGRAGRLTEAFDVVKSMPMEPNNVVWGTLLGACRVHMNMEMVALVLLEVGASECGPDCIDDARSALISNIYAASSWWEEAEKVRVMMLKNGTKKTPGCSSIMVGSAEHHSSQGYSQLHKMSNGSQELACRLNQQDELYS
ncbi:pentatricopeptide repeat-containing protein At3g21470 [Aristolochia californica]|uniref:pentatricopeptide repeat-containing protein At3g21470 n=1 Tax=Aristolochia californica TaxID=171875 RepID=UPI0035D81237